MLLMGTRTDAFSVSPPAYLAARCRRTTELSSSSLTSSGRTHAPTWTGNSIGTKSLTTLSMAEKADVSQIAEENIAGREFQVRCELRTLIGCERPHLTVDVAASRL